MSGIGDGVVVTQLIIDSRGAEVGSANFVAAMEKARAASVESGAATASSFENAQKRWVASMAATDPVLKAQLAMQKAIEAQTLLGNRAVELGIATQAQAAAQVDALRLKHEGLVAAVGETKSGFLSLIGAEELLERSFLRLTAIMLAFKAYEFAKDAFDNAAALKEQAAQAGVGVEAFQAYRAVLEQAGISSDQSATMIARLTKNIGEAKDKTGPARDAFNEMGISFQSLQGNAEETLPKIAASLLQIPDAAERARVETVLFGRAGQEMELALKELIDPTATLIEKQKALGLVLGTDVADSAQKARTSLTESMNRLKDDITPPVVFMTKLLSGLIEVITDLTSIKGFTNAMAYSDPTLGPEMMAADMKSAAAAQTHLVQVPTVTTKYFPGGGGAGSATSTGFSTTESDKLVANDQMQANLAGLSAQRRAEEEATIALANKELEEGSKKITDQNGMLVKQVSSYDQARQVVGDTVAKHVEGLAAITAQEKATDKLKETFSGYIDSLHQAAQAAGESNAQRATDVDLIKAANVWQAQNNVLAKDRAKTVQEAKDALGPQKTLEVEIAAAAAATAAFDKQIKDQTVLSGVALSTNRDQRQLALQIAQEQLTLGRQLTDQEKEDLATVQHRNDLVNLGDYMDNLRQEVSLAGLAADERQRQAAVLQEMHATHGTLTQDQANEITGIIAARQETEKWRAVVDQIQSGFQTFFDDILTKGKADFGSLFRAIESSFAQMLAQMAAQAIAQPIIVPMVESVMGSGGLGLLSGGAGAGGGGGAGGAGGALSSLGSLGSLGSVGSGGSLLGVGGIGGAIDGIGMSLGFGAAPIAATSVAIPGLAGGAVDLPALDVGGSVFGTSLGGFLGGAGIGALAGNLIFGNKNDASTGSMGGAAMGAAIGSIIPGIGTIIGGLIGGVLGGGLGSMTGSSNKSSTANLINGGQNYAIVQTGSQQNTQLVTQAATAINTAVSALDKAGVTLTSNISGINIGTEKDYLYYTNGQKQKLSAAADPNDVVNQVLTQLLSTASATDADIQKVIATYQGQGGITTSNLNQFLTDIGVAKSVANPQVGAAAPLSQAGQALKAINDQVAALEAQAQQLGLDTSAIEAAGKGAIQSLVDNFDDTISKGIDQLTNPIGASMRALVAQQQANLADATDLGANVDAVLQENVLQAQAALKGYIDTISAANQNLSQWEQAAQGLAKAEMDATSAATALGYGLDQVQQAASAAHAALASSFNSQVNDSILKITNPNLAAYNELLASQAQRIKDATAAGGDLNAVYQLNALEQRQMADSQAAAAQQAADAITQAAAAAAAAAQQAAQTAAAALATFNTTTADAILKITNPALATYNELLANQAQRVKDAIAVGGDLNAVYQLNSLEQQQLADSQAAAALNRALTDLGGGISTLTTNATAAANAAQQVANGWGNAYSSLTQASTALLISSPGLSPSDQYAASRRQFDQLRSQGLGGDASAASSAASFASQFLQSSFGFNGSTAAYGSDFSYVQATLSQLSQFSQGQQSAAQAQADAFASFSAKLTDIAAAIRAGTVTSQSGFDGLAEQVQELSDEIAQENLQARHG